MIPESHHFVVESGQEEREGRLGGFHVRFLPEESAAGGFSKRPQIVDRPGPDRRFAVFGNDQVRVSLVFRERRRFRVDPAQNHQAAVRGVVRDELPVTRHGPDLGESARVGRRQLVEHSGAVEKVALGRRLTVDPHREDLRLHQLIARHREAEFLPLVRADDAQIIHAENVFREFRDRDFFEDPLDRPFFAAAVVFGHADQLAVPGQFVVVVLLLLAVLDGARHDGQALIIGPDPERGAQNVLRTGFRQTVKTRVKRSIRPVVVLGVLEHHGAGREVGIDGHADPLAGRVRREFDPLGAFDRDGLELFPRSVARLVDLEAEIHGFSRVMLQMNAAKVPAAEEERLARDPGFDRFVEPERSAADRPAQFRIEFGRVEEPEVGVGLAGLVEWAFERAFVEELALCRVVAAADDFAAPEAEVADHFQVRGTGADPEGFLRAEIGREVPELAVHRHEEIVGVAHFADARPLRIPAVRAVVAVRRFGEAVLEPLPAVQDHQDERAEIPPDRPERLAAFFLVEAENAARAGHFGELVAQNDLPVFALSVPLAEGAGGDFGTAKGFGGTLPVIRVHVAALGGVKPFSVVARQNVAVRRVRFVRVAEKLLHLERFHVDLVEALLHRHAGDFIGRVGQVPGVSRVPAGHFLVVDHPDVSLRVDHVRADEELIRFFVDHPVRGRAAD